MTDRNTLRRTGLYVSASSPVNMAQAPFYNEDMLIYDLEGQDVHAGGSGCGCSASVLAGHLLKLLESGQIRRLLFAATGALMSPTASMQGESIPGICHAVAIETQVNT